MTVSISAGSMRTPRILIWESLRPKYSSSYPTAVFRQRTKSPVRYRRAPSSAATNRSAVNPGWSAYPRASPLPARYSSPDTPGGTGRSRSSSTTADTPCTGAPIVTGSPTTSGPVLKAYMVVSAGP